MTWVDYLSLGIGVIGVAVILWGVLLGVLQFVQAQYLALAGRPQLTLGKIRHNLGRYLLLGLEFLVAADVIRSIVKPSLQEVTILAIIVAIRTVISFFLNREIERSGETEQLT